MLRNILLLGATLAAFVSSAQSIAFNDQVFFNLCVNNDKLNTDNDNKVTVQEAMAFTDTLDLSTSYKTADSLKIHDLTGLSYFVNITGLSCVYQDLPDLDLSANTKLLWIDCRYAQVENLNISGLTELKHIRCCNNSLTSIDVSSNAALEKLDCDLNYLTQIDLSSNSMLNYLYCPYNQISVLDVSQNQLLQTCICFDNQLSTLDFSQNPNLTTLNASLNQLVRLDLRNGNNQGFVSISAKSNSDLLCISVDNVEAVSEKWIDVDEQTSFNNDCDNNYLQAIFLADVTTGEVPLNVQFSDFSTSLPENYLWDFGDGQTSTETNPIHQYTQGGVFSVSLTVTENSQEAKTVKQGYIAVNSVGITSSESSTISVYPNPVSQTVYFDINTSNPIVKAEVMDQSGRVMMSKDSQYEFGQGIDVSNFDHGFLLIEVTKKDGAHSVVKVLKE